MGRYSGPLAPVFMDFVGVAPGWRALDVGCGPGALTAELVRRLSPGNVVAVDPSVSFVEAARERHPGVTVHLAGAEQLPLEDRTFDAALAQLVVHFMSDPVLGLREMARVARPGGVVAACVWDFGDGGSPLSTFWAIARELDPSAPGEAMLPGTRQGHLAELFGQAGLGEVEDAMLTVAVEHPTFEEWWQPYELGVGPAGAYVASLEPRDRDRLRDRCQATLPGALFTVTASAWAARGVVGDPP